MNTSQRVAVIAFSLVACAAHARDPNRILLACPVSRLPTMQDVAQVVGTTNFWSTYHARERVLELAKQACKRGAVAVNIVPGTEPDTAVARRDGADAGIAD